MTRLQESYKKEILPRLKEDLGLGNEMEVPKIEKVVVNVGLGAIAHDKDLIKPVMEELSSITGQRPVITRAKKSIANFNIREGAPVGMKVTLRKERMYEFIDRLINFVIPRIRDFRGVSTKAFDQNGNYTLGIRDQSIFPELELDKIKTQYGMDICFVTTAKDPASARKLLERFGMPFARH